MGFQTGWEHITLAGSYQSKVSMGEFNDYALYFAESGKFDIPSTYTLGMAYTLDNFSAVVDYQRINYGKIPSLANSSLLLVDAGFGWKDVSVIKLGVQYKMGMTTVRAGFSHAKPPIDSSDLNDNFLIPYVVENHVSAGLTHTFNQDLEMSVAYTHGLRNTVSGLLAIGDFEELSMYQNSLEFSLGVKF